jgi:ABC-type transport system involved in multi-copper enzyme maturation permease subunit
MMGRVGRLTAAECLKLFAQPFLYIGLAAIFICTVLGELLQPLLRGQNETIWRSYNSVQLFAYGFGPGLKVTTYVLLIFSSMMFAGEFDRGTIKNLLTRPITRFEFFIAKCVTISGLALLLFGFVFYVSAAVGLMFGDVGPIWHESQYYIHREGPVMLAFARKAVVMSFMAFLAAGFLGILVSNLTESSGYSVAIALVAFLVGDLAMGMLLDKAKEKFFMYYSAYPFEKLTQFSEGTNTKWNEGIDGQLLYLVVPALYIAVFIPLAFSIFRSRNITA